MPRRRRRLWRVYAACSALQAALVVVLALAPLPDAVWGVVILLIAAGVLFALGPIHAHIALNRDLDEAERIRWRVLVWTVPGAVAFYWYLYVG